MCVIDRANNDVAMLSLISPNWLEKVAVRLRGRGRQGESRIWELRTMKQSLMMASLRAIHWLNFCESCSLARPQAKGDQGYKKKDSATRLRRRRRPKPRGEEGKKERKS